MLLCFFVTLSPCYAQTGMHISALFEGKIVPTEQMIETRIRGKAVSQYKLSYFHSVRFKADDALVKRVDHLTAADFVADTEKIKDRELDSSGTARLLSKEKTFTQMYELAPHGNTNRYLCYKVSGELMTVIYLEGTVASLDELKRIFK